MEVRPVDVGDVKTAPICSACGSTDVRRHGEHSTCGRCTHTGHNYRFTGRVVRPEPIRRPWPPRQPRYLAEEEDAATG